ncbi:MAG: bifunctional 4-hydroxy-2-oxoglutarate aldolase/2-dehydro-3-deoxy-phosphogluconate aldolase [Ruminococcaceae bacterium]|nr:bifunctional 4-hydroxy-2-oxoglutarate aldolase/2-dehydro-3-deoxy-phosphogluconate aldolase [Oscillospiraceae bacterium]
MFELIRGYKIVPVVKIDDAEKAVPLAKALIDAGLPVAEITYRTAAAQESIRRIAEAFPQMLVGAGTVLTTQQVDSAISAGAKFIVSPGFNPKVTSYAMEKGITMIPGVCTPTELEAAMELGLRTLKFFPAEQAGGASFIKAIGAPYGDVSFIPTGGISESNMKEYLSLKNVLAIGGSWMVKSDLIANDEFAKITELTKKAVELAAK